MSLGHQRCPLVIGELLAKIQDIGTQPAPSQSLPVDHRGSNGAPNCSSNHPNLPHIGFDGSRTNGIAVAVHCPKRAPNMGTSALFGQYYYSTDVAWLTRICASLGLRMKFKTLFIYERS